MKTIKKYFLFLCITMLFGLFINIRAKASSTDVPIIELTCDNNMRSFLQSICDDIYKRSEERFIPN